jgi:hypothetical protein
MHFQKRKGEVVALTSLSIRCAKQILCEVQKSNALSYTRHDTGYRTRVR